ncbi:MAG: (deoxy)nucleoside triphosphate pyrophosphohydrolase [Thermodesulfobacteria bacterium]|nr:(deoxy)nucleoside triphosphate pyrophosphohydrolase [Thermodesulfobacteriota bacterium]
MLVVAGVLKRGDEVFLVKRPLNKKHGGKWEFPGGKVEKGEKPEDAIVRELKEELGIEVEVKREVARIKHSYGDGPEVELILFEVESEKEPEVLEAEEGRWIRLKEVGSLNLCEADAKLLPFLEDL